MIPLQPPAQVQPPPAPPMALADAVEKLLDEFDRTGRGTALPDLEVALPDRPALRWLKASATQDLPENPFPLKTPAWLEAEAVRALLPSPPDRRADLLARLPLAEPGSQLALWRWGKRLSRQNDLPAPLRIAWEDALLAAPAPTLVSTYALRHALSFALATEDLERFGALKAGFSTRAPDLVFAFQRLFGFLGTPGPVFAFWRLPEMTVEERSLASLGGNRIWVQFLEPMATPVLPEGTVWLLPVERPPDPPTFAPVPTASSVAGQATVRLGAARQRAWLSPNPEDLESAGFAYFPVLIELQGGAIKRIRMGDAAPAAP